MIRSCSSVGAAVSGASSSPTISKEEFSATSAAVTPGAATMRASWSGPLKSKTPRLETTRWMQVVEGRIGRVDLVVADAADDVDLLDEDPVGMPRDPVARRMVDRVARRCRASRTSAASDAAADRRPTSSGYRIGRPGWRPSRRGDGPTRRRRRPSGTASSPPSGPPSRSAGCRPGSGTRRR